MPCTRLVRMVVSYRDRDCCVSVSMHAVIDSCPATHGFHPLSVSAAAYVCVCHHEHAARAHSVTFALIRNLTLAGTACAHKDSSIGCSGIACTKTTG